MSATSLQDLSAYVIYMMLGSYFKKAVCKSPLKEGQLRVSYSSQKRDNQIKAEERCDNYITSKLVPNVPENIFDDMVEVKFSLNNGIYIVEFTGFDWKIYMWANQEGSNLLFDYKYKKIKFSE